MRNFRSDNRSGGFDRDRGGFGRNRNRDGFRDRSRRPLEMHEVTCDKCGKQCEVPFKPSGDKPVLCSDCFRSNGSSRNSFGSRTRNSESEGISQEQFKQLNEKIDKILGILEEIEFEELPEDDEEDSEENNEESDKESDEEENEGSM